VGGGSSLHGDTMREVEGSVLYCAAEEESGSEEVPVRTKGFILPGITRRGGGGGDQVLSSKKKGGEERYPSPRGSGRGTQLHYHLP